MGTNKQLITAMREAGRLLTTTSSLCDPDDIREHIVTAALEVVPGADAGGLTASENGTITSSGPATGTVRVLDQLQDALHEGPSVSVVDDGLHDGMIVARDLAGDDARRWPRFAPRAVEAGFRAVLSMHLSSPGEPRTEVLNLYANRPHAFDDAAVEIAALFGLQAAGVLHCTECAINLERSCGTEQANIALAKGILMERFAVNEDEAFHLLVHAAHQQNTEVAALARSLRGDRSHAIHTTCS